MRSRSRLQEELILRECFPLCTVERSSVSLDIFNHDHIHRLPTQPRAGGVEQLGAEPWWRCSSSRRPLQQAARLAKTEPLRDTAGQSASAKLDRLGESQIDDVFQAHSPPSSCRIAAYKSRRGRGPRGESPDLPDGSFSCVTFGPTRFLAFRTRSQPRASQRQPAVPQGLARSNGGTRCIRFGSSRQVEASPLSRLRASSYRSIVRRALPSSLE